MMLRLSVANNNYIVSVITASIGLMLEGLSWDIGMQKQKGEICIGISNA